MSASSVTAHPVARRVATVVRPLLLVVGVLLALLAVFHYAHGLGHDIHRLTVVWFVPAAAAVLAASVTTMLGWRSLLAALGHPLGRREAARVFFVSQVGKYLPGSVWPYLAQMQMASELGVPAVTMGVAGLVSVVVGLVTAGLTAAVVLPAVAGGTLGHYWWALLALLPLAALLRPAVLGWAVRLLRRVTRRPGPVPDLSGRGLVVPTLWWFLSWLLWGLHIWFLTEALGGPTARLLALSVGGFALAWLVGFLVVVSPAGAGAREAVLVLILAPVLGTDGALLMALSSRLLTTAADVLLALAAAVLGRGRQRPGSPPPEPADATATGGRLAAATTRVAGDEPSRA